MDGMIYLDNAATSYPKPEAVHDKMIGFYRTCGVNQGRSGCDMALQAVRFSAGRFNTEKHILAAIKAVGEIAAKRG